MTDYMDYFKDVMSDPNRELYMRPPNVPIKDVGKRLPPTRTPSSNSPLVSIKESSKEVINSLSISNSPDYYRQAHRARKDITIPVEFLKC